MQAPALIASLLEHGEVVSQQIGFEIVTGTTAGIYRHPCDGWSLRVRREAWGSAEGVRVSIVCATGEDYYTGSELAVLFRLQTRSPGEAQGLERVWFGLADQQQNTMDVCISDRRVQFRLDGKILEKEVVEETRWMNQTMDPRLLARHKRDCKLGRRQRIERTRLP